MNIIPLTIHLLGLVPFILIMRYAYNKKEDHFAFGLGGLGVTAVIQLVILLICGGVIVTKREIVPYPYTFQVTKQSNMLTVITEKGDVVQSRDIEVWSHPENYMLYYHNTYNLYGGMSYQQLMFNLKQKSE